MNRRCSLLAVLALVTLVPPASPQAKSLKIALIAKSEANFVFLSARRGAEAKAAALSRQLVRDWLDRFVLTP